MRMFVHEFRIEHMRVFVNADRMSIKTERKENYFAGASGEATKRSNGQIN